MPPIRCLSAKSVRGRGDERHSLNYAKPASVNDPTHVPYYRIISKACVGVCFGGKCGGCSRLVEKRKKKILGMAAIGTYMYPR